MYYANCEWYVDMGEHNKPLCKRNSMRPAKCSECPIYIRSIETENAKLREELAKWERLAVGIDLPEYPVTQFEPKDLERENAKLRKLCSVLYEFAYDEYPDGAELNFADLMREFGIEADE